MQNKMKEKKNPETRQREVESLMSQFLELGIPLDEPGTQEFIKITKDFVDNCIGSSGTIKFTEFDRNMKYIFSTQPHVESRIVLEHVSGSGSRKANNGRAKARPVQTGARAQ
jgi:hypothetical protein